MGEHAVRGPRSDEELRAFTAALLEDVRAFEVLLESGLLETGPRLMGVEQEMFLVDARLRPAPVAPELLARLDDRRLTSELALFNLEANLDPAPVGGAFLRELEQRLRAVVAEVEREAETLGARVLLTGSLPTLQRSDLEPVNMSPEQRYAELNRAVLDLRGSDLSVVISGEEELEVRADSIMLESANTSLQLHLQVAPDEVAPMMNLAQLVTAPLLAAAASSPLLLGRRLWHETRIALFERSVDARSGSQVDRGQPPRVFFGRAWAAGSALDILRETVARHRVVLVRDAEPDAVATAKAGRAPRLLALSLHNGTVWPWNRLCYGSDGVRGHVRIENRALPAGPSITDEVANAAFFYGLMAGLEEEAGSIPARLAFADARDNFVQAARHGLGARFTWLDSREVAAPDLLLELAPRAREGLRRWGTDPHDVDRYLGVIEERVRSGRTGARWMLDSVHALGGREDASKSVTAAMLRAQQGSEPVHRWPTLEPDATVAPAAERTVADVMSTDLFTVQPRDVVDLATSVMQWEHVRHVPVEDDRGRPVGIVSYRSLLRLTDRSQPSVADIMDPEIDTIAPDASLPEAAARLLESTSGCLLVVSGERLVGIVTEHDLLGAVAALLGDEQG